MSATSLVELLEKWAQRTPERPLLTGPAPLSYAAALAEARARAHQLEPGPVVIARVADRAWVIDVLAAMMARRPLVLIPPEWTEAERAPIAEWMRVVSESGTWAASDAALAFATSGTTGRPRLAVRSALSLVDEGERYRACCSLGADDVFAVALPLHHAYAFGAAFAGSLTAGASIALVPTVTPRAILRTTIETSATVLLLVAPLASAVALLDSGRPVETSLRIAMVGAGAVTGELASSFVAKLGIHLSQNYGSSETGATLACFAPDAGAITGRPMPGVECALPPGAGDEGELWVRLQQPPLGYVDAGGLEQAALAPGGWWATGDIFHRESGSRYRFVRRRDHRIRRGGRSIDPIEVALAIGTHPGVNEVHVVGEPRPGSDDVVAAHVSSRPGHLLSIDALTAHVAPRLATYKIPTAWHFHRELPRAWSGKLALGPASASAPASWFHCMLAGRLAQAALAGDEVGLWAALTKGPRTVSELAHDLGLDRAALTVLVDCMLDAGLLVRRAEAVALASPPPPAAVFELERRLSSGWLGSHAMAAVLRSGIDHRAFERTPCEDLARVYSAALGGSELQGLARAAVALTGRSAAEVSVLELGRAVGVVAAALERPVHTIAIGPPPIATTSGDIVPTTRWEEVRPREAEHDVVVVLNAVHWLAPERRAAALAGLIAALRPGGVLAIIDVFAPERASLLSTLRLDWMTHGGPHPVTAAELVRTFREAGATDVRHRGGGGLWSLVHGRRNS